VIHEDTNWPRLYGVAALIGAGSGLLLALGILPFSPEWPEGWGLGELGSAGRILVPIVGGALVGVMIAGASHLGVKYQLRGQTKSGDRRQRENS
jgi:hypothetical protein